MRTKNIRCAFHQFLDTVRTRFVGQTFLSSSDSRTRSSQAGQVHSKLFFLFTSGFGPFRVRLILRQDRVKVGETVRFWCRFDRCWQTFNKLLLDEFGKGGLCGRNELGREGGVGGDRFV